MPTKEIRLIVPEGTSITIVEAEDVAVDRPDNAEESPAPPREEIERYWGEFLSDSGKKIFTTAALIERQSGPGFTLDQIAAIRSVDYDSAKAWHRNTGRTAKRWREETGTGEPIRLEDMNQYGWKAEFGGDRTVYRLHPAVREAVLELQGLAP
jgi:hypothetical protein